MGYAKLFSSITESSLWSEPKEARLLFVSMLARCDANGFVEAAIPGLARLSNLTVAETEAAIASLEGPDPYSKNPDNEGRRILKVPGGWVLINYGDYRNRRDDESRREYMREYMRKYRKDGSAEASQGKPVVNKCKHDVSHGKPGLAQATASASASAKEEKKTGRFAPPTLEAVKLQAAEIGLPDFEADKFFNYYESKGWIVGKSKMKSWPHALTNWRANCQKFDTSHTPQPNNPTGLDRAERERLRLNGIHL